MLLVVSTSPVRLDLIILCWRTIKSIFLYTFQFYPTNYLRCCTSAPAVKSQRGSVRLNRFVNICLYHPACNPLNHQKFSKGATPSPFLLKNVTVIMAVNTSLNCAIGLKKYCIISQSKPLSLLVTLTCEVSSCWSVNTALHKTSNSPAT